MKVKIKKLQTTAEIPKYSKEVEELEETERGYWYDNIK